MSTPTSFQATASPTMPADVSVLYPVEHGHQHSTWVVRCGEDTAAGLQTSAELLTLTQVSPEETQKVAAAERLCAMVPHRAVLTVVAVSSTEHHEQIWYEPAEAGTLADYCSAKGQLPLEQVSRVAHDLCEGLVFLHANHLAYSRLSAESIVFTVEGELKLLAPDRDVRQLAPAVQNKHFAEDVAAAAALLWLCLTGESVAAQRFRKPLSLSVPECSETLAKTLEDAIDLRSNQPGLQEISALFELAKDPEPLELHLSAHESVAPRLPAIRPVRFDPVPKERFKKKPVVVGQLKDFSAPARKAGGKTKSSVQALGGLFRNPLALIALGLVLAAGGLAAFEVLGQGSDTTQATVYSQAEAERSATTHKADQSQTVSDTPADGELDNDLVGERLAELIATRSEVLATGASQRVGEYAVADTELYQSDMAMIAQDAEGQLAGMSTQLASVDTIERKDRTVTARVTIEAKGYKPQGNEAEMAEAGMFWEDGKLFQRVIITAQVGGDGNLLLEKAEPATTTQQ